MKSTTRLLFVGLALSLATVAVADDKSETINPNGKWPKYAIGQTKRYMVWHNDSGWHVRTTCPSGQRATFSGTIKIIEGHMETIGGFGGLEKGKGKNTKNADYGTWNKEKTQLEFHFVTNGKEDGIDFTLSSDATAVQFNLNIDSGGIKCIFIGKEGQNPPAESFQLPAKPTSMKK